MSNSLSPAVSTPAPLTEPELVVRQSSEEFAPFDPQRITDALVRETRIAPELAQQISLEIQEQLHRSGMRALTAPLIRCLVDAKLLEYGQTAAYRLHTRLGVPLYDVDRAIQAAPRETETALHGPDGTSLALAAEIKREYAMLAVFSETVANAHLAGDLHIENLGEIDRPTTMIGSLDFIKRYGVRLPGGFAGSRPARRPEVLAAHLVKHTAALHGYFSEALAWDSVNFAIAPLLVGLNQREMKQIAQVLLFELSAPAVARGGQLVHCDLHLDWDCPPYLQDAPVVGAGGEKQLATYGQHVAVARDFLKAFFEVYLEGDGQGLPFTGPRPVLHVTEDLLATPGQRGVLELIMRAATERGGVLLVFDRPLNSAAEAAVAKAEAASQSFTARYGVNASKLQRAPESWQWRAALFSAVAINLPRLAYRAAGSEARCFALLSDLLELAAQASLEKRVFLEKLLARGEAGALSLLAMRQDNEQFLPLGWTAHALCPVGLAELTQGLTGKALGADASANEFAARIAAHLHQEAERLSLKHKVRFHIAESHDLSAPHRFARLDLRHYDGAVFQALSLESAAEEEVFYTNALKLPIQHRLNLLERLKLEGDLQAGNIWGGASALWLGESVPTLERLLALLLLVFHQTQLPALALAPEFTICLACLNATRGPSTTCPQCGSARLDNLALAANRYSYVSTWPRWMQRKLQMRRRDEI
ncbi:MAG: anaerobic ribonucleoside-triphosphate reductase [Acidobacteria bacterium]|nr:anaerobic ribonucleoside-triphosphate reductase [Acidobacteriota bacterium]MBI3427370.1 anaerobic ribonucleoside-triphosphate reductase [Acidobacteriota bacterium]